jgi:polar amino acid transport system ATP-binding protein
MSEQELMVDARGVRKWFGSNEVLKSISLTIPRGEVLSLLGPSGSGKSTFLRCINHLESIDGGRIYVDGELIGYRERGDKIHEMKPREIAKQRRKIGMVFPAIQSLPAHDSPGQHHRRTHGRQW